MTETLSILSSINRDAKAAKEEASKALHRALKLLLAAIKSDPELAKWFYERSKKAAPAGAGIKEVLQMPYSSSRILSHDMGRNNFIMIVVYWAPDQEAAPSCVGIAHERYWHQGSDNPGMRWRQTVIDPRNGTGEIDSHWLSLVCSRITTEEEAYQLLQEIREAKTESQKKHGFYED